MTLQQRMTGLALFMLTACGAPSSTATDETAPVDLTAADLEGTWAESGVCESSAVTFLNDGTWSMDTMVGTETGRWSLEGSKLVIRGLEDHRAMMRTIDRNSFELTYDGDSRETWKRCP